MRPLLRAATDGFGVACLITLPFWWDRFSRTGSAFDEGFLERTSLLGGRLPHIDYASGLLAMLLVMLAAAFLLMTIGRKGPRYRTIASMTIAVIAFIPALNYLRIEVFGLSAAMLMSPLGLVLSIGAGIIVSALFVVRRTAIISAIEGGVTIAAFAGLVVVVNGASALSRTIPDNASIFSDNRPLALRTDAKFGLTPVIWIIFDEWDYRISFESRPKGLVMPAIDLLVNSSFSATNATPPGMHTAASMPALTTGLRVLESRQGRGGDLMLKTKGGKETTWRDATSVFGRAQSLGARSAVLSHAFGPYCGSLHRSLVDCREIGRKWSERQNAFATLGYVMSYGLRYFPGIRLQIIRHYDANYRLFSPLDPVNSFITFQREVDERLRAGGIDLLLLHYEIPHSPIIFDRRRGAYRTGRLKGNISLDAYSDNLALLDRTFSQVRKILEDTGRFDHTALIVSSDHHFRHEIAGVNTDLRVPFIVKLPGQQNGVIYSQTMETLSTATLIPALLLGQIADYKTLIQFINNRSAAADKHTSNNGLR